MRFPPSLTGRVPTRFSPQQTKRGTSKNTRRGAATVEFAICLPILVLLCFGTIEACTMIYLKQSLTIAAYEGARTANGIGSTTANVQAACQQIIDDRGIVGTNIQVTPPIEGVTAGNFFVVECTAPCASNAFLTPWFFGGRTLEGRAEFVKKY